MHCILHFENQNHLSAVYQRITVWVSVVMEVSVLPEAVLIPYYAYTRWDGGRDAGCLQSLDIIQCTLVLVFTFLQLFTLLRNSCFCNGQIWSKENYQLTVLSLPFIPHFLGFSLTVFISFVSFTARPNQWIQLNLWGLTPASACQCFWSGLGIYGKQPRDFLTLPRVCLGRVSPSLWSILPPCPFLLHYISLAQLPKSFISYTPQMLNKIYYDRMSDVGQGMGRCLLS